MQKPMYPFSINLTYLRLKLLKTKIIIRKYVIFFIITSKIFLIIIMSEVSLKRFYFALFDDGLTLKTLKLAFIGFTFKLLIYCVIIT